MTFQKPAESSSFTIAMAAAPAPEVTILTSSFFFPNDLQCVGQAGQRDDGGAVLVVVEDGDVALFFQLALDLKASGRGNILKVDAAERAGDERDGIDEFVYIVRLDAQREGIHIAEGLEEHAFALHDRHAGLRPISPRPRTAEPSVMTAQRFQRRVSS